MGRSVDARKIIAVNTLVGTKRAGLEKPQFASGVNEVWLKSTVCISG